VTTKIIINKIYAHKNLCLGKVKGW